MKKLLLILLIAGAALAGCKSKVERDAAKAAKAAHEEFNKAKEESDERMKKLEQDYDNNVRETQLQTRMAVDSILRAQDSIKTTH